jgi:hypothetical protein
LIVHNFGFGGATAHDDGSALSNWENDQTVSGMNWSILGALSNANIVPDVLYVALGINDISAGNSASQITNALARIRGQYPNSDFVLIIEHDASGFDWGPYVSGMYNMADVLDCPLVDMYDRTGGYAVANVNGIMGDVNHVNQSGHCDWGRNLAMLAAT